MSWTTTSTRNADNGMTLAALRDAHLEYLKLKHYSEATVEIRRIRLNMFLNWCAGHGLIQPTEIPDPCVTERWEIEHRFSFSCDL